MNTKNKPKQHTCFWCLNQVNSQRNSHQAIPGENLLFLHPACYKTITEIKRLEAMIRELAKHVGFSFVPPAPEPAAVPQVGAP